MLFAHQWSRLRGWKLNERSSRSFTIDSTLVPPSSSTTPMSAPSGIRATTSTDTLRGVMTFADGSIYPEEGILDFTAVTIRAETGTLQGRFTFPNPSGNFSPGQSNFLPGQFVTVRLKGYHRLNAILIPQRAVQHSANGSFVYVVDDKNKVELRQVHATTWHDNDWLIERGLKSGEKVIVAGFHRVQPGIEVTPVSKNAPENNRDNSGAP